MKRLMIMLVLAAIALTVCCASAAAENHTLSVEYVPRTTRGTLFYLDVYSEAPVGAAIFELRFDPGRTEYRSVYCDDNNAAALSNADGGTIKIAYSNSSERKDKLFRVAFKALSAGDTEFTLSVSQAVDGELRYIDNIAACTLTVKLGQEDVAAGKSAVTVKGLRSSESSKKKSYGSSKSYSSEAKDENAGDLAKAEKEGFFVDLSGKEKMNYLLLGGGAVIAAGLLVAAGMILGKKIKKPPAVTGEQENDDLSEEDELDDDAPPSLEEIE